MAFYIYVVVWHGNSYRIGKDKHRELNGLFIFTEEPDAEEFKRDFRSEETVCIYKVPSAELITVEELTTFKTAKGTAITGKIYCDVRNETQALKA